MSKPTIEALTLAAEQAALEVNEAVAAARASRRAYRSGECTLAATIRADQFVVNATARADAAGRALDAALAESQD